MGEGHKMCVQVLIHPHHFSVQTAIKRKKFSKISIKALQLQGRISFVMYHYM